MVVKSKASTKKARSSKSRPKRTAAVRGRMRFAKGRRPFFFEDAAIDKLLGMVMALTGEVAVVRERLDTHERLAKQGKVATPANIEKYSPDLKTEDEREAVRAAMLSRVFRLIAFNENQRSDADAVYQNLIDDFAES